MSYIVTHFAMFVLEDSTKQIQNFVNICKGPPPNTKHFIHLHRQKISLKCCKYITQTNIFSLCFGGILSTLRECHGP